MKRKPICHGKEKFEDTREKCLIEKICPTVFKVTYWALKFIKSLPELDCSWKIISGLVDYSKSFSDKNIW